MPWNMSSGHGALSGGLRNLFCTVIPTMIEITEDSASCFGEQPQFADLGAGPFERLKWAQQLQAMASVLEALTTAKGDTPEQDAVSEGAIYAVFSWLAEQFDDIEIGMDVWGEKVIQAARDEQIYEEDEEDEEDEEGEPESKKRKKEKKDPKRCCGPLDMDTDDGSEWAECCREHLADRVLWDRDFQDDMQRLMQRAAAGNPNAMQAVGIEPGYYGARAPGGRQARAAESRTRIWAICEQHGDL